MSKFQMINNHMLVLSADGDSHISRVGVACIAERLIILFVIFTSDLVFMRKIGHMVKRQEYSWPPV